MVIISLWLGGSLIADSMDFLSFDLSLERLQGKTSRLSQNLLLALFDALDKPFPDSFLLFQLPIIMIHHCETFLSLIDGLLGFQFYDLNWLCRYIHFAVIVIAHAVVPFQKPFGV